MVLITCCSGIYNIVKLKSKAAIIKFRVVLTTGAGSFSHISHVLFRDILNGILNENSDRLYFFRLQDHYRRWLQPWNWKTLAPWKKSYDKLTQHIKKQRHHFADKLPYSQSYGFSSIMYGCESWTINMAEHWKINASSCGVGADSWESLGPQGDQTSQF